MYLLFQFLTNLSFTQDYYRVGTGECHRWFSRQNVSCPRRVCPLLQAMPTFLMFMDIVYKFQFPTCQTDMTPKRGHSHSLVHSRTGATATARHHIQENPQLCIRWHLLRHFRCFSFHSHFTRSPHELTIFHWLHSHHWYYIVSVLKPALVHLKQCIWQAIIQAMSWWEAHLYMWARFLN